MSQSRSCKPKNLDCYLLPAHNARKVIAVLRFSRPLPASHQIQGETGLLSNSIFDPAEAFPNRRSSAMGVPLGTETFPPSAIRSPLLHTKSLQAVNDLSCG